jgi:acyl carrier protein
MQQEEIFSILKNELRIILKKDFEISLETGLFKEEIVDSLEWLAYITRVEEIFDISISDEEADENQLGIMKNMVEFLFKVKQS